MSDTAGAGDPGAVSAQPRSVTGGPGRPRSERARAAVIEAVTALLDEVGYQHLTVEAVAARAGVGRTTVYRWWPTKAALVIDALAATVPSVEIGRSGNSRADLRAVVDRLAGTECGPITGETLAALAAESRRDQDVAIRLAAFLGPRRAADSAVLLTAAARGDVPHDVDVPLLLDVALGTLLWRRLRGETPTDAVVDALTDLLLRRP